LSTKLNPYVEEFPIDIPNTEKLYKGIDINSEWLKIRFDLVVPEEKLMKLIMSRLPKDKGKDIEICKEIIKYLYGNDFEKLNKYLENIHAFFHLFQEDQPIPLYRYFTYALLEWLTHMYRVFDPIHFYRDHFIHSSFVLFMGDLLLKKFLVKDINGKALSLLEHIVNTLQSDETLLKFLSDKTDGLSLKKKEAKMLINPSTVLLSWQVSSLFHDVGYYLAFLKDLTDINDVNDPPFLSLPNRLKDEVTDDLEYITKILPKTGTGMRSYLQKCRLALKGNYREKDYEQLQKETKRCHTFWSTLELLKLYQSLRTFTNQKASSLVVILSARAIFKHHFNGSGSQPLVYENDPIGVLLKIIDEAQDCSRKGFEFIERKTHRLSFKNTVSSDKINLKKNNGRLRFIITKNKIKKSELLAYEKELQELNKSLENQYPLNAIIKCVF